MPDLRRRTRSACRSCRRAWQVLDDVVLEVGGDALQSADRDGLGLGGLRFLDAAAPACGLARSIARAAENSREHVRFPVDEIGVGVAACRDQADVLGNWGVGGACPLAIDNFMEVVRIADVGGSQFSLSRTAGMHGGTALAQRQTSDRRPREFPCQQELRGENNAAREGSGRPRRCRGASGSSS
jgi:hypothetical protein